MQSDEGQEGAAPSRVAPDAVPDGTRLSRRQVIGRMSALATAGATAWVVPEILTAKPAGGATLSVVTSPDADGTTVEGPSKKPGDASSSLLASLAYTGLDIERDAQIGAALIAGGWALHHWASRTPAPEAEGPARPA